MHRQHISYQDTGYFTKIVLDYLEGESVLEPFYDLPFSKESFQQAIEKQTDRKINRSLLSNVLKEQYDKIGLTEESSVLRNIKRLAHTNTFTITTGHQLCLLTGPLYFIYKIISVINLCEELKELHNEYQFVPVYWMATEDHDFEEINHFNLFGKKWSWEIESHGPVGRLSTTSLQQMFEDLKTTLGESEHANKLINLFKAAYLDHDNLADATRFLVHQLFEKHGLVCIDADHHQLKTEFKGIMESELKDQYSYKLVSETNESLSKNYKIQVNPRNINLFYQTNDLRERIIYDSTEKTYNLGKEDAILNFSDVVDRLNGQPEAFSPNVILRPLYQETILPNLAYIGGGAELAYWFQLKSIFDHHEVYFPILVLRNSVLWVDKTAMKKLVKNNIDVTQLFLSEDELIKNYVKSASTSSLTLDNEENVLNDMFAGIIDKFSLVDQSLVPFAKSEQQKYVKALKNLEGRLMKGEKKKQEVGINQLKTVKEKLFPNKALQERYDNFTFLFNKHGDGFLNQLKDNLNPLDQRFLILSEEV